MRGASRSGVAREGAPVLTPAERAITHALELLAEMPRDPKLEAAKASLLHASNLIARYVEGHDTEPDELAPISVRREMPIMPDGAT